MDHAKREVFAKYEVQIMINNIVIAQNDKCLTLTKGDIRFQWKYGFYFIYLILVILYSGLLSLLPVSIKDTACNILVYSDPAAMGMFFMGAIVLLEKSQRVLNGVAVSPISTEEYIAGKILSIGFISIIVGLVLMIPVRSDMLPLSNLHLLTAVFGIAASSVCFTLCGIIVGTKITSLTEYIVGTIPFELIGFVPPIMYILGFKRNSLLMLIHPGCAQILLISGGGACISGDGAAYILGDGAACIPDGGACISGAVAYISDGVACAIAALSCVCWIVILYLIARKNVRKMFMSVGGAKI